MRGGGFTNHFPTLVGVNKSLIVFYILAALCIFCRIEIKKLQRQQRIQMLENAENQKEALEKEKQEMLLGKEDLPAISRHLGVR